MSERYVKVFSGEPNLYTENAPVVIQASALLKDTETGKMIAQLKFQNISGKVISYVKVAVTSLDAVQNTLGDAVAFEYLDLSVADKENFGTKQPLILSNTSTRAFSVNVTCVGFADSSVWTGNAEVWKAVGQDSAVSKAIETEAIYKKALSLAKSKKIEDITKAKEIFESIQGDKDVTIELSMCSDQIKKNTTRKKKSVKLATFIASGLALIALLGYFVVYPFVAYQSGNYAVYINMYHVKEFEVPAGVTRIQDEAFKDADTLENVIIPESVTFIGSSAFRNCGNLKNVVLPNSIYHIGSSAFYGCKSLTSITLPSSISSIDRSTFALCYSLESITISKSITLIQEDAFECCYQLKSIYYNGTKREWNYIKRFGIFGRTYPEFIVYCTDGEISS